MTKQLPAMLWIMAGVLHAQPVFETSAVLAGKSGEAAEIRLLSASGTAIRYRKGEAKDVIEGRIPDGGTLYVPEPAEYAAAMNLYQARKYTEAKAAFAAIRKQFAPIQSLKNNPASLAAFHEMECLRKTGDLDGLAAALQGFSKDALTDGNQLRQIELYLLWDAVRTKSWEIVDRLAGERAKTRLPGDQRSQVAWCRGLALEGLNRPREALDFYQTALTADAGASEEIARQAALRILAIHKEDPAVQAAMKAWGTAGEDKTSQGRTDLLEAAAVADLYQRTVGAGVPLPSGFTGFLKYRAGGSE